MPPEGVADGEVDTVWLGESETVLDGVPSDGEADGEADTDPVPPDGVALGVPPDGLVLAVAEGEVDAVPVPPEGVADGLAETVWLGEAEGEWLGVTEGLAEADEVGASITPSPTSATVSRLRSYVNSRTHMLAAISSLNDSSFQWIFSPIDGKVEVSSGFRMTIWGRSMIVFMLPNAVSRFACVP